MIKRSTWVVLVIFIALAAFAIFRKYNANSQPLFVEKGGTPTATITPVQYLFSAEDGTPVSFAIEDKQNGGAVELKLGANGAWALIQPEAAAADAGSVQAALSQVNALRILSTIPQLSADAVGLQSPTYTITVEFSGGKKYVAEIGDVTPSDDGYYVRKDNGPVLVISRDGLDALIAMLQTPPYLETPTPSPTLAPTETNLPQETPSGVMETPSATPTVTKAP